MPQMTIASCTYHFSSFHSLSIVFFQNYWLRWVRLEKAGPFCFWLDHCLGDEKRIITCDAMKNSLLFNRECAASCRLCSCLSEYIVLLRRQDFFPFLIGFEKFFYCHWILLSQAFLFPFSAVLNAPGSPRRCENRYRRKYGNYNNGNLLKSAEWGGIKCNINYRKNQQPKENDYWYNDSSGKSRRNFLLISWFVSIHLTNRVYAIVHFILHSLQLRTYLWCHIKLSYYHWASLITFAPLGFGIFNSIPILEILWLQRSSALHSTIHGCALRTVTIVLSAAGLSRWVFGLKMRKIKRLIYRNSQRRLPVREILVIFDSSMVAFFFQVV